MCCHSTFFCAVTVLLACARTTHVGSAIVALLCTACNFVLNYYIIDIFKKDFLQNAYNTDTKVQ